MHENAVTASVVVAPSELCFLADWYFRERGIITVGEFYEFADGGQLICISSPGHLSAE